MNDRPTDPRRDERLDATVREAISDYNEPPRPLDAARRDAIFARIQAERATRDTPGGTDRAPGAARARSASPKRWRASAPWIAAAAVLLLGIGIGRWMPRPVDPENPTVASTPTATVEGEGERWSQETAEALYRIAARDYLARTATLLTEFRFAAAEPVPEIGASGDGTLQWAGDLLLETRLLLDSPAGEDERLATLLRDLELVLAEIVQLTEKASPRERELIRESVEERSLLLRLQRETSTSRPMRGA